MIKTLIAIIVSLSVTAYFSAHYFLSEEKLPVTIAVSKTPLSLPFYVAKSINAFERTCVDVRFVEVSGGVEAFKRLNQEQVDFSTSSDSVIAFKSLLNQDFVSHAVFSQSDNDVKLLTRNDDMITSMRTLKGKNIGVIKNSASEYLLSILLALEGITLDQITLVGYQPNQLTHVLMKGEVDAIVLWEPFVYESKMAYGSALKIHDTKGLNTLSFNLLSNKNDPAIVQKAQCVLQGLNQAIEYIATHPLEARKIAKASLNLEEGFINWIWTDYIFKLSLNNSLIQKVESQLTWVISSNDGQFEIRPNANKYVDERALLIVDPQAVNIYD